MTKTEIDLLADLMEQSKWEEIVELCNDDELKSFDGDKLNEDFLDLCFSNIMAQIEMGEYEYFISKVLEYSDCIGLLAYVKDSAKAKKLLEGEVKGIELSDWIKLELLEIMEEEYRRAAIEGKIDGIELGDWIKIELLATMEEEYKRNVIEDKLEGLLFDDWVKLEVLVTTEEEYKRKAIEGNIDNFKLDDWSKLNLLKTMKQEYKRCAIEEKIQDLSLDERQKLELLKTMDDEYKREVLEGKTAIFELDDWGSIEILKTMDDEYKIKALEGKIRTLDVGSWGSIEILKTMNEDYKRKAIEGEIEGLEFYDWHKVSLLVTMDEEYKRKAVEGKIEGLELYDWDRVDILKTMDEDYKIKVLEGKVENIELNSSGNIELLKSMSDEYKKAVLDRKIDLTSDEILALVLGIKDREYVKSCAYNMKLPIDDYARDKIMDLVLVFNAQEIEVKDNISFSLPESMTIGVEIENEGGMSEYIRENFRFGNWIALDDGSLVNGVEIVSPILHPTLRDVQDIYRINKMLAKVGQKVSERCGAHVHIGANYLTSKEAYVNLMEIWCNTEKILYAISNEKGQAPRGGTFRYSHPITKNFREALERGSLDLRDEEDLDGFINELKAAQGDRYSGLNLLNINNGKNTIEFRLANGTINPEQWIDNINLFGGIIAVSQELTVTDNKDKKELFFSLKEDISNEEKLKNLLELIDVDPTRYMERYNVNMELMNNVDLEKVFHEKKEVMNISPEKIREMTEGVPALSQLESMSRMLDEMERQTRYRNIIDR